MAEDLEFSPDGRWWWNGLRWIRLLPSDAERVDEGRPALVPWLPVSTVAFLWPTIVNGQLSDDEYDTRARVSPNADLARAQAVMAAAVVALRSYGLIELAVERRTSWLGKETVETRIAVTGQAEVDGIESRVLAGAAGQRTVRAAVERSLPSSGGPWAFVNEITAEWAVEYGVMAVEYGSRPVLGPEQQFWTVPDVVVRCRPQARALAEGWRRLHAAEPELVNALWNEVGDGIARRATIHPIGSGGGA